MNPQWLASLGNLATIFLTIVVIPVLLFLLHVVWQIKTNDLPHIYSALRLLLARNGIKIKQEPAEPNGPFIIDEHID